MPSPLRVLALLLLLCKAVGVSAQKQPSIFINCGVTNFFTDFQGNGWEGDEVEPHFYTAGNSGQSAAAIENTFEDFLYQTERWDSASGENMRYNIPVINGLYEVKLHFAEVYWKTQYVGGRVFNVTVQDIMTFPYLDIFKEAGGYTALVKTTTTTVNNGILSIEFFHIPKKQNPKINAIEIHPIYVPSVLINCGGPSFVDDTGLVWMSDSFSNFYNTGTTNVVSNTIEGTTKEVLYKTERWDPRAGEELRYEIPLLNGTYDVHLHFAETYNKIKGPGLRTFHVALQGQVVFASLDIFAEAGQDRALIKSTSATVTDGMLTIDMLHENQHPKICAIEIHPQGRALAPPDGKFSQVFINAGSTEGYIDRKGATWGPDDFYMSGHTFSQPGVNITGTQDMQLFQSTRYKNGSKLKYNIPAPEGEYMVILHFVEIYSKAFEVGFRVFDIALEERIIFEAVDIYAEVGPYAAMSKSAPITVTDGAITIELLKVAQNPSIAGIEIRPLINATPKSAQEKFKPIRINAGSKATYTDKNGNVWAVDAYYNGGKTLIDEFNREIHNTEDDSLYHSERWGPGEFKYEIPVPDGQFRLRLHFAELYSKAQEPGKRLFDVRIEGQLALDELDIFEEAGNGNTTLIKEFPATVTDGALTIEFLPGEIQNPKVSAIEIDAIGEVKVHQAHAVPGGPYIATDTDNTGSETVEVDGKFSHTHGPGAELVLWNWSVEGKEVGFGEKTNITLPIGKHRLDLEVRDSEGDIQSDFTTVTIRPYGFPDLSQTTPMQGDIAGNELVVLNGEGFNFTEDQTTVHFGTTAVSGTSAIRIVNDRTIEVVTPPGIIAGEVDVTVETPIGTSNAMKYTYIDGTAVAFTKGEIYVVGAGPTTCAFGPDGRLYLATQSGDLIRLTLNEAHHVVDSLVSNVVKVSEPPYRVILGIAFDPMDISEYPTVYVAHSFLFHKQDLEKSYNGKVSKVSGPNLDQFENVITGLPVSDHDHGINGMEFDDFGNLYIQVGGNTNAGIPGPISSREQLDEGYYSAATIVAHLTDPNFDGDITYDEQGYPITGSGIEVFASGLRNSYDIVLHSNGNFYATDNGPNFGYGPTSFDCETQGPDPKTEDKLVRVIKDRYYGHPNRLRGQENPRECVWRLVQEEGDSDYEAPLLILEASTNGIIEFQSEHFGGQLRGRLVLARYKGELWSVALNEDGTAALTEEVKLDDNGGLDVTQGPDGTLFIAQNADKMIIYLEPLELEEVNLVVKSTFPRRGPEAGGSKFSIYGKNLDVLGKPKVIMGGNLCPVLTYSSTKITCTIPSGSGTADIVVTSGAQTDTFKAGYRYITGGENGATTISSYLPAGGGAPESTYPPTKTPTVTPTGTLTASPTYTKVTDPPTPAATNPPTTVQTNPQTEPPTGAPTASPTPPQTLPQATPPPTLSQTPPQTTPPPTPAPTLPQSTPPPTPAPTAASSARDGNSFGISKFVLVDAITNKDIEGGFDCSPTICTGSATYFGIRAETFGHVQYMHFKLEGPHSTEKFDFGHPFTLSGLVNGDYNGISLPSGLYRLTAEAFKASEKSPIMTLEFIVSGIRGGASRNR